MTTPIERFLDIAKEVREIGVPPAIHNCECFASMNQEKFERMLRIAVEALDKYKFVSICKYTTQYSHAAEALAQLDEIANEDC